MFKDVVNAASSVASLVSKFELILKFIFMVPFIGKNVAFAKAEHGQKCMAHGKLNMRKGKPTSNWMSLICGLNAIVDRDATEPMCICSGRIEPGDVVVSLFSKKAYKKKPHHERGKTATNAIELVAAPSFTMMNLRLVFPDNRVEYGGMTKCGRKIYVVEVSEKETKKLGEFTQGLETYELRRKALRSDMPDEFDFDNTRISRFRADCNKRSARLKNIRESVEKRESKENPDTQNSVAAWVFNDMEKCGIDVDNPRHPANDLDHQHEASLSEDF